MSYLPAQGAYADSLDSHFGALYWISSSSVSLNTAAYESLKSQGLRLISDQALRSRIVQVYERDYARLQGALGRERETILDVLRPYFTLHFADLRFGQSATPLDYAAIATDTEFINLAAYRLQLLRANQIPRFETSVEGLREEIDAVLR